jgi:hypothetical protein
MELAPLIDQYRDALEAKYADRLLPGHHAALDAMRRCRTSAAGEILTRCTGCGQIEWHPRSCGHRSCPKCQNHETTQWLERQREKLLPVDYFLVTFTLPRQLRILAFAHQREVFNALFCAAIATLKAFGLDPKHLGAELGMTAVLHTHSRQLEFHPHLHVIVPGGGVDRKHGTFKRIPGAYLFNEFALAKVFRGKFRDALAKIGLTLPENTPKKWVVDCEHVGRGESALEYLSRYLYRGVISEANILHHRDGQVTFRYSDSQTGEQRTRTLPGEHFLWLLLQHVLPRGFHRVRDYGFLHHNAQRIRQIVQLILQVTWTPRPKRERPGFCCSACGKPMEVLRVYPPPISLVPVLAHGPPLLLEPAM